MTAGGTLKEVADDAVLPDLLHSEVEDDLRASVRTLLMTRSPWQAVLERTEAAASADPDLWRALAVEVGVTALPVPEHLGGGGASWRETSVVIEELGRAVAPVPYLGSSVVATALAAAIGADDLLRRLASGANAVLLFSFGADRAEAVGRVTSGQRLHASVSSVADALLADVLVVPTSTGELLLVEADDPSVSIDPVVSLDMTRQLADVRVDGAKFQILFADGSADGLAHAFDVGAALLASEQLGVAEWCLDTSVAYLKDRRQFGRTLGSYQALKHRCADLWVEIMQARAVARYAACCAATGDPDLPVAAALAQAQCSLVAVRAAEECVQLHGGIGFTWESPAHLYLKRAKSAALAFGSADLHRARLATLVDLPAPEPSTTGHIRPPRSKELP